MPNIGPMEIALILLVLLIQLVPLMALIAAIRVPSDSDFRTGTKLIWVLVIIFLHCIGAAHYYALGKPAAVASRS